jgi:hypothetical protein
MFAQGDPGVLDDLCATCGTPFKQCLVDIGCVSTLSDVRNYLFGGFLGQVQGLNEEVLQNFQYFGYDVADLYYYMGELVVTSPFYTTLWVTRHTVFINLAVTSKLYYFYYFMGGEAYILR